MTSPSAGGGTPPMTPERWRMVDAILQAALVCEPGQRDSVVAAACGGDEALRAEVISLLAVYVEADDQFLERPAADTLGSPSVSARLSASLAGRYAIDREIARGGMATVHLARDLRHHRLVAIKVLREELAAAVGAERFLAEIRVTASLQHPHILPLFDSGNADGLLWYAMPFVDGETLRMRLAREGSLSVADAVRIAREVAGALEHAHARGVVHRDVKPENVLLRDGHALVADFGIALALEQAGGERLTHAGLALGTPQYMAPEQAAGERALDARVDVYALGAVLHEMLAGEPPFAAPTRQAVVRRMMNELPPMLALQRPEVTPFVDSAVRRALAKHPDDRFPTAAAFDSALETAQALVRDAGDEMLAGTEPSRGRTVSARGALFVAGAMLAVGLAAGLLLDVPSLFKGPRMGAPSPPRALAEAPVVASGTLLTVFDRGGRMVREIPAERPWTPRFSPDGRSVAYGAFGGRGTSDIWIMDLASGATQRVTDDDADSNDPQWSADGSRIAYSAGSQGMKDIVLRAVSGGAERAVTREGMQYPSDWLRDGSALLVTEEAGADGRNVIVQPADGSPARAFAATPADETTARASPDGRWVAYTSDESGRAEVYVASFNQPGQRVKLSTNGGAHPVWRGDGRELYYWRDGAMVAVQLGAATRGAPPANVTETVLFRAPYDVGVNTMYDVSPDGQRFVIVRQHP